MPSPRTYVITWLALLGLTALTFWLAHVPLGAWNTPVALGIAFAKATLIGLFFMHLVAERFTLRFVLVASALFVILLVSVVVLDAATRFPLSAPPDSDRYRMSTLGKVG